MKRTSLIFFEEHHWPVRIAFAPSRDAWDKAMRGLDVAAPYPETTGRTTTLARPGHNDRIFITLGPACDAAPWERVVGTMAHECVHVVQAVEDAIGGKLGDEPAAYLVEALLVWLLDAYRSAGRGWREDAS